MVDALSRIRNEEGISSFWKGATPSVLRGVTVTISMLVTYDESKERISRRFNWDINDRKVLMSASSISALAIATFALPLDNMKTKL